MPPAYLLCYLVLGLALHITFPLVSLISSPMSYYAGILFISVGVWIVIWAAYIFKQKNTTIKPFQQSSALVQAGPFRFSRNPMYLSMTIILLGVAVLLGSLIVFIAPIAFIITINKKFIPREEKMLEERFGEEYRAYKKRVPRWL